MYQSLIGEKVTVVVSTGGFQLLEYVGTLSSETEDSIELTNVSISYMFGFVNAWFTNKKSKYEDDVRKVILNKKYIISCDKE